MESRDVTGKPVVLRSIVSVDGTRGVDLFRRADGSYGYEEFRRDHEDPGGWRPLGGPAEGAYADEPTALAAAKSAVGWLDEGLG